MSRFWDPRTKKTFERNLRGEALTEKLSQLRSRISDGDESAWPEFNETLDRAAAMGQEPSMREALVKQAQDLARGVSERAAKNSSLEGKE